MQAFLKDNFLVCFNGFEKGTSTDFSGILDNDKGFDDQGNGLGFL